MWNKECIWRLWMGVGRKWGVFGEGIAKNEVFCVFFVSKIHLKMKNGKNYGKQRKNSIF